eukprot:5289982-Pyramimonas_sp.AAC.1
MTDLATVPILAQVEKDLRSSRCRCMYLSPLALSHTHELQQFVDPSGRQGGRALAAEEEALRDRIALQDDVVVELCLSHQRGQCLLHRLLGERDLGEDRDDRG